MENYRTLYNVKLLPDHTAPAHQVYAGYLGEQKEGRYTYPRGEAIRKAQEYGGKIEKQGNMFNAKIIGLNRTLGAGGRIIYKVVIDFNGLHGTLTKNYSQTELESYFGLERKDINSLVKTNDHEE